MIDYETFARIKHLHEHKGLTAAQITRELALDERTVRRWLAAKQYLPRKAAIRPSKLDPFKATIIRMIESYPYTAQQLWQRLREEGFTGGYTAVKKFVRTVRPKREKAFLTLAFAPGNAPRSIGVPTARSGWAKPLVASVSLSWCSVTAGSSTWSSPSPRPWSIS